MSLERAVFFQTGKLWLQQSSHILSIRPEDGTRESERGSPSVSYLSKVTRNKRCAQSDHDTRPPGCCYRYLSQAATDPPLTRGRAGLCCPAFCFHGLPFPHSEHVAPNFLRVEYLPTSPDEWRWPQGGKVHASTGCSWGKGHFGEGLSQVHTRDAPTPGSWKHPLLGWVSPTLSSDEPCSSDGLGWRTSLEHHGSSRQGADGQGPTPRKGFCALALCL